LLGVTAALIEWQAGGGSGRFWAALGLGVAGWGAFAVVERRAEYPLVEARLLRGRVFAGGTLASVLWGLGMNGVVFYTSLYLQTELGASPVQAGLAFVPVAVAVAMAVPPAGGLVVVAVGLLLVAAADPSGGVRAVLPGLVVVGLGSGLTTPLTDAVLAVVPADSAGVASAVVSAAREMSGVLGIAVVGLVIARYPAQALGPAQSLGPGFRAGLVVAAGAVLLGAAIAAVSLRHQDHPTPAPAPTPAP
jgi:hypothetical protein